MKLLSKNTVVSPASGHVCLQDRDIQAANASEWKFCSNLPCSLSVCVGHAKNTLTGHFLCLPFHTEFQPTRSSAEAEAFADRRAQVPFGLKACLPLGLAPLCAPPCSSQISAFAALSMNCFLPGPNMSQTGDIC